MEAVKAPKIFDPDALDRMARVEGEAWRQKQEADKTSAFGFYAYLAGWRVIEKEGYVGEASPYEAIAMDMVPGVKGGDGAIYGDGGYARYTVTRDGTIRFDYGMASRERQEKARAEGFPPG